MEDRPPATVDLGAAYRVTFWLLGLLFEHYLTTHVSGRENLPPPGTPTVLVTNHSSVLDVAGCAYLLKRPGHFLAKREATQIPLFGRYFRAVGAIPARRDRQDLEALRRAMSILRAGGLVGIAPEGTRRRDGRLGQYDPGFVWLALRTGAVVAPVAIHNAYCLMPPGAKLPRRGEVWMRIGPAVSFADEGTRVSRERMSELAAQVREMTADMLAALERESGVRCPELGGSEPLFVGGRGEGDASAARVEASGRPGAEIEPGRAGRGASVEGPETESPESSMERQP
jgi:1-acyl-sn-glycerol-3-phosphate acyltransferase